MHPDQLARRASLEQKSAFAQTNEKERRYPSIAPLLKTSYAEGEAPLSGACGRSRRSLMN